MDNYSGSEPRLWRNIILIFPLLTLFLGLLGMAGWCVGYPILSSFGMEKIPMAPSTALLFLLYGIAVYLRLRQPSYRGSAWFGLFVHTFGALSALLLLILYFNQISLNIEHLVFSISGAVGGAPMGHMSPVTAVGFLLAKEKF